MAVLCVRGKQHYLLRVSLNMWSIFGTEIEEVDLIKRYILILTQFDRFTIRSLLVSESNIDSKYNLQLLSKVWFGFI